MAQYFQVRSLIDKATVDSKDATTGYLYVEINKLTEQSDSACTSVLDYVMKRLRTKSPRVKQKALLVMKNCIEKGHPTFRAELVLRAEEIRAELGCSGPPDPHEGEGPYRKVREEAEKVLNMMYDEQYARRDVPRQQQSMEGGQDSQPLPPPSFLPSPAPMGSGGGGGGGGGGGKRYEGMGNWTPPAESNTWVNKAVGAVSGATTAVLEKTGLKSKPAVDYDDPELYTRQAAGGMGSGGTYAGPTHGGDAGIRGLSAQQANLFEKKKQKLRRKPGEAGGTWKHGEEEEEGAEEEEDKPAARPTQSKFDYNALNRAGEAAAAGNEAGSQHKQQQQQQQQQQHDDDGDDEAYAAVKIGGKKQDLETSPEWRLVDTLTRGGGVRSQPTDAELHDFVQKAESLAWRDLSRALLKRLDDGQAVVRLKALCGLLALVERGRPKGVAKHLKKHPEAIVGEASSANRAVRAKAAALVALLFGDQVPAGREAVAADSEEHHQHTHYQHQQQSAPSTAAAPAAAAKTGGGLEMLSFLDTPSVAAPALQPVAQPVSLFQQQQPSLQQQQQQQLPSLANLNLGAPTLQAGPTYVAPPAAVYNPYYGQPAMTVPQPYYHQPAYYSAPLPQQQQQHVPMPLQMHMQPQPQHMQAQSQQQRSPFAISSPPPPANDSFSFVQSVVQTEKKNVVK